MARRIGRIAAAMIALLIAALSQALANPVEIFSDAWAENCGRFTIAPGNGESLVDPAYGNDYRIHLEMWDSNGDPLVAVAAQDMWLDHSDMQTCSGYFCMADGPSDNEGHATFSGTIHAGMTGDGSDGIDCDSDFLYVYALGIVMNDNEPVCVSTDSPDLDGSLSVGISDFGRFVQDFNCGHVGEPCDLCHDYNEDGQTALEDLAIFALYFNASLCP